MTTIFIACISYIVGMIITAALSTFARAEAYEKGYKEGWMDAKERYIEKIRHIDDEELVEDILNSMSKP